MIDVIFKLGSEYVFVRIIDDELTFMTGQYRHPVPIEALKLSESGAIREFPDLEGDEEWKQKAIQRFKERIVALKNEEQRVEYTISELSKYGYEAVAKQKMGFRAERIKKKDNGGRSK